MKPFTHHAMKTYFEVMIAGEDAEYAGQAARAVFQEIDRIETLFSRFNPSSEISQINRLRPGDALIIGVETYECLSVAERIRIETGGAFDINVRSYLSHKDPAHPKEPGRPSEKSLSSSPSGKTGAAGFELIKTSAGFELRRPAEKDDKMRGLDLDLGGIGKGYALEHAPAILSDWGISRALIHAGTSTAIGIGSPPDPDTDDKGRPVEAGSPPNTDAKGGGWPVGVGGARPCPGCPSRVLLKERALSGSGTEVKGRHILDPRTGLPARRHPAAWASHPSAAESDALSTAFMVMSTDDVGEYCRLHPDVWALVIATDETCRVFNPDLLPAAP